MNKKTGIVILLISVVLLIVNTVAFTYINKNTTPIETTIYAYRNTGSGFIMADDRDNKECIVKYTFNDKEQTDTITISATKVNIGETLNARVNTNTGKLVSYSNYITLIINCIFATISVFLSVWIIVDNYLPIRKEIKNV